MLFKHLLYFLFEMSIFSLTSAGWTLAPGVKAAFRDLKHTTHHHYGKLLLLLFDKLIFHRWSREKMLTTSDRISLFHTSSYIRTLLPPGPYTCQHFLHQKWEQFQRICLIFLRGIGKAPQA